MNQRDSSSLPLYLQRWKEDDIYVFRVVERIVAKFHGSGARVKRYDQIRESSAIVDFSFAKESFIFSTTV